MNFSIQQRFSIWAGLSLLSVVLVTSLIGVWQFADIKKSLAEKSYHTMRQQVDDYLQILANDTTAQLSKPLEKALQTAQATATAMQAVENMPAETDKRSLAIQMLKQSLSNNPDFLGTYVAFEPDAFDGQDAEWRNSKGSDNHGRFLPYVVRTDQGSEVQNLQSLEDSTKDKNGVRAGEYYLCPKDTHASCVIDPYLYPINGKQVLMTSLIAPVMLQGRFIGISGIDIKASFLQSVISNVAKGLYHGQGQTLLASPRGVIVGFSQNPDLVGKNLSALEKSLRDRIQQVTQSGKSQLLELNGQIVVLKPFKLPGSKRFWVTYLAVPEKVAMAAVAKQEQFLDEAQTGFISTNTLLGLLVAILGVVAVWFVARNSTRPLSEMTELVASIAEGEGDLTRKLTISRQDETGKLSHFLNVFIEKLRALIKQLLPVAGNVSTLSAEGRRISDETSSQMLQQQNLIEEMVSAVTQMAASAQQIAGNAENTSQFTQQASDSADSGAELVQKTATSIKNVSESVQRSETAVQELEKNSAGIAEILSVIQGIAEQTNLLALNAAIEAARAGDKGRGFAVVADEVRALASRTQEATVDIQNKLDILHQSNQELSSAMLQSGQEVNNTVTLAQSAEAALAKIEQAINEVIEMTLQTASATEEQSMVCEEVSKNLSQISHLVQQTTEGAQQLSRVGSDLDQAAIELQNQLALFKV